MTCDMNEARAYYVKWNKSVRKRQIPHDFTHIWNLRNKWAKEKKEDRDKPRNRLLTIENKLMVTRGKVSRGRGETVEGD